MNRGITHVRAHGVAYLALFVALGGTGAWAAAQIGAGDIKRNAVRSKHIKAGHVKPGETDLTKIRHFGATIDSGAGDPPLTVSAKRGDLILIQASVEGRQTGGPGSCRVFLNEAGPNATSSLVMLFPFGPFQRRFIDGTSSGTASRHEAQSLTLPVLKAGKYRFNLAYPPDPMADCEYRNRNLFVGLLR